MTGSNISSKAKIGCNFKIGDFSIIQGCQVAEFATVGAKSVILPGVNIGKDSLIGAESIVNREVPPLKIVVFIQRKLLGMLSKSSFKVILKNTFIYGAVSSTEDILTYS